MAGDWIQIRCDLRDEPEVVGIACRTGLDQDSVVGKLVRLWGWANRVTPDGKVAHITAAWIDAKVEAPGFAQAMVQVGWLQVGPEQLTFPNYERYNSKAAKQRALDTLRKQFERAHFVQDLSGCEPDKSRTREEKRREEKRKGKDPPNPPRGNAVGFEEFWLAYPRHTNRERAEQAWQRLQPNAELLARILAALDQQRDSQQWKRGVVPHPSSWLNGRRWEDEPYGAAGSAKNGTQETDHERARRLLHGK